jgi:hypothetical protein
VIAETNKIEGWLRGEQARRSWRHLAGGIALLVLSIPAIIVTFVACGFLYGAIVVPLISMLGVPDSAIDYTPVGAVVILMLCFVGYRKSNKDTLADLSFSTGTATDTVVHISGYVPTVGVVAGSNVNPLAPDSMRSMAKMVTSVLFMAPALSLNAVNQLVKAYRARAIGIPNAAQVIRFLATRAHRVAYTEIAESVPDIDLIRTFRDLTRVEGVLVLVTTPPGLSLNDRLRGKLERL